MHLNIDIFQKLDQEWALLTAGTQEDFNTMTVSWGAMGTMWSKPAVTVYVRDSRHTLSYMNKEDYFTLSFYPAEYKKDLGILGSKSGRDTDKVSLTTLTPEPIQNTMTFKEANITLVCRKRYAQRMDMDAMPKDVQENYYADNDMHTMFIGEVVEIITK